VLGTTSATKQSQEQELVCQVDTLETADGVVKDAHVQELKATLAFIDSIDVLKEAQELKISLTLGILIYDMSIYAQPSFEVFSDCMRSARQRNVRILHFAGRGQSRYGFF